MRGQPRLHCEVLKINTNTAIGICAHICACTGKHYDTPTHTHMCTHMHIHIHSQAHTDIDLHIYMCTHTQIHIHP